MAHYILSDSTIFYLHDHYWEKFKNHIYYMKDRWRRNDLDFVKEFKLRGVPTTVLINKQGKEFARIIGEVNFEDRKFLKWLSKYD